MCFFVPEWTFQPWNREQASAQTLATTKATPPTRSLESPLIQSPIEIVDGGYYPAPQGYFFAGRLRVRVLPFAAWATFFFIVLGLRLGAVALRLPAVFFARGLGLGCGDCSDFVAHHAIPGGARFSCPTCELTLSAAQEPSPDAYMDVNGPGTQALPRFAAEGPSG